MTVYHVDGDLVPAEEATVNVRDRGFMYGDAAFETLRAYGGEVFEWDAHADRLARTCETLAFADALPPAADLRERIDATLAANDLDEAYVRLSVTRGVQPGKLTPDPSVDPTVVIVVSELPRGGLDGESVWDGPATVETVERRRPATDALPADAKTHNYLNGILARLELRARSRGGGGDGGGNDGDRDEDSDTGPPADEALLLDADGHVTEGATCNLFVVDGGVLKTPALDLPVLPGVTRAVVIELAREAGIPVEEGRFGIEAVPDADECFLTNSTWELRPVERLDGREFAVGSITEELAGAFDERVEARCYE